MKYIILMLMILFSIETFGQSDCYKITGIKDPTNIVFEKEKMIVLDNKYSEDRGKILIKVYFIGEPLIKIQKIKSEKTKEFIAYEDPIYGIIYSKLLEYFDKYVCIQYEENLIYTMSYVFEYYTVEK